jgi:hypothetical protein
LSGTTRNVSIRLSVEGAEVVRRALQETGEQGQRALTTLDTATQRAAGQMVALRTNTEQAARSGTNFNQVIGQAGFQIGDFATQVQAGGSALTAFSQQAGQFLGVFGTGGAIAGAVLTVGLLATQFLNTGSNAEDAKKGIDAFAEATQRAARDAAELVTFLDRVSGRFQSIEQRQIAGQRRELELDIARLGGDANQALLEQLDKRREAGLARNRAASLRGILDTENDPTRVTGIGLRERQALERDIGEAENQASSLERDAAALEDRVRRLDFELTRTQGLRSFLSVEPGTEENLGPNDRPSREGRGGGGRAAREEDPLAAFDRSEQLAQREAQRALAAGNRVKNLREETERAGDVARELGLTFSSAFEDAVVKGNDLRGVLQGLVQDVSRIVVRKAVTEPLGNAFSSGLASGFPALFGASGGDKGADFLAATSGSFGTFTGSVTTNANGNAFGAGDLIPFARGGIVDRPTVFPFARGIGLMGEAGPEAIMPLKRGPDGKLGVAGGGGQVVNVTIMANDPGSFFGKNGRQVTRELAAAVDRGRR